jgi:hypothetical protein
VCVQVTDSTLDPWFLEPHPDLLNRSVIVCAYIYICDISEISDMSGE